MKKRIFKGWTPEAVELVAKEICEGIFARKEAEAKAAAAKIKIIETEAEEVKTEEPNYLEAAARKLLN